MRIPLSVCMICAFIVPTFAQPDSATLAYRHRQDSLLKQQRLTDTAFNREVIEDSIINAKARAAKKHGADSIAELRQEDADWICGLCDMQSQLEQMIQSEREIGKTSGFVDAVALHDNSRDLLATKKLIASKKQEFFAAYKVKFSKAMCSSSSD